MATAVARSATLSPTPNSAGSQRLAALDALRGLASFSVFVFHVYAFSGLQETLRLPKFLDWPLRHGSLGVQVFFVLSGVVIFLSISGAKITWGYISQFTLRRMLRLDPPYWATLLLASTAYTLMRQPPPMRSVLAHCFYLQNLLGYRNIVSQFWTLCYEVQFYLFLIVLVAFAQRTGKVGARLGATVPVAASLVLLCTGTYSRGWFIDQWYAFAVGVATAALITRRLNIHLWMALTALILAIGLAFRNLGTITIACTGLAIGIAAVYGKLITWTGGPVLQWLGRISYSLYLTHFISSRIAKGLALRVHNRSEAALLLAVSIAIALCVAEIFYLLVEHPAHRISRQIRLTS